MKKILFFANSLVFLLVANHLAAQISFGPKLGLNVSSMHDANHSYDYKSSIGGQVGGIVNFQINDYFSIRPELMYSNVGAEGYSPTYYITALYYDAVINPNPDAFDIGTISTHEKYRINYLSIPLNFVGQIPINEKFKLQAFAGPYAAIALNGTCSRTTTSNYYDGKVYTEDKYYEIKMGKPEDKNMYQPNDYYMNRFDLGFNFGIGFQLNSFVFSTSYSMGTKNIRIENDAFQYSNILTDKTYNRNLSFSLAYLFGGK